MYPPRPRPRQSRRAGARASREVPQPRPDQDARDPSGNGRHPHGALAGQAGRPRLHGREYTRWRTIVLDRAGHRCEWIEGGQRCTKAEPAHTLFADHIVERQDGGALYDPANGQALCGSHHSRKTALERARRMAAPASP